MSSEGLSSTCQKLLTRIQVDRIYPLLQTGTTAAEKLQQMSPGRPCSKPWRYGAATELSPSPRRAELAGELMIAPQLYVGTGSTVNDRVLLARERWRGSNRRGAGKRCLLPAPGVGWTPGRAELVEEGCLCRK